MEFKDFFTLAKEFGLWAALFVGLLIYTLRCNAHREDKLIGCLDKMADKFGIVEDIKSGMDRIERVVTAKQGSGGNGGQ